MIFFYLLFNNKYLKNILIMKRIKMKTITALILGLSVNPILAAPFQSGFDNLATGTNSQSVGNNNITTSTNGSSYGTGNIATGNNMDKASFDNMKQNLDNLLQNKNNTSNALNNLNNQIEINQKTQSDLNDSINALNSLNASATNKLNKLKELEDEKLLKENELIGLQQTLSNAQNNARSGTNDRTIWTDFSKQINNLEWNKLNQTNGVNILATDLKNRVETDLPELTKYDVSEYESIINGYINRQGLFDVNKNQIQNSIKQKIDSNDNAFENVGFTDDQNSTPYISGSISNKNIFNKAVNNYLTQSNTITNQTNLDLLSSMNNFSFVNPQDYTTYNNNNPNEKYLLADRFQNMLTLSYITSDPNSILYKNQKRYKQSNETIDINFLNLYSPTIKENSIADKEFASRLMFNDNYNYLNFQQFIQRKFTNDMANGSQVDSNYIKQSDIQSLKKWHNIFVNDFYNKIDWDADQSKWTIDKDNYRNQIAPVKAFADKIKEYTDAYDAMVADPTNRNKQIQVIDLYNEIRRIKDNPENFYNNIKPLLTEDTKNLFNTKAQEVVRDLQSYADRMKLYDPRSTVIAGTIAEAQKYKTAIDNAQKAIDDKNKEIVALEDNIKQINITNDEKNADALKQQKQKELQEKIAEKAQLEKNRDDKQKELDKLNNQIANSSLSNIGKENIALGYKSFVSGERGIVIGQENTVLANNSVVIGQNNILDANATNTFVLGSNITTNVPNSVVLGNNSSVSNAVGTDKVTIRNVEYNFAGTQPIGTVSVGANNKERTITNVAAGQINATSTDAINGSQLYSVVKAVNDMQFNQPIEFRSGSDGKIAIAKTTENGKQVYTLNWNGGAINNGSNTAIRSDDNTLIIRNTSNANTNDRNYNIEVNKNLDLTQNGSLTIGNSKISNAGLAVGNNKLDADGLNIGNNITIKNNAVNLGNNVVDGVKNGEISANSKQAINGSQLYQVVQNVNNIMNNNNANQFAEINNRVNNIDKRLTNIENRLEKQNSMRKAGHASALAAAGLMQAYAPGQSSATAAIGQFQGQSAVAVGFSSLSDNGKFGVKGSITANTQNEVGGNVGIGYFW